MSLTWVTLFGSGLCGRNLSQMLHHFSVSIHVPGVPRDLRSTVYEETLNSNGD
jgi:hypothetical protein